MAMTKCKECKQQVSTSAKTCPHCGVKNPGTTTGQIIGGMAILLVGFFALKSCGSSSDSGSATEQTKTEVSDADCRKDLQCWGDRQSMAGSGVCKDAVEKLAKYSARWVDGTLEMKFDRFRWKNQQTGEITLVGDKVEFQNGFGAYQRHIYECDYNPDTKSVTDARAEPGHL